MIRRSSSAALVLNRQRKHAIDAAGVHRFVSQVTSHIGRPDASLSVVFVTDKAIQAYNRQYRYMDKATDVLSFAAEDGDEGYLGDILISTETAYSQAGKSSTLSFETNIRRLLLHGILHLVGYDHETDHGEMRALERRLRRRFQC
jgi:probable rRNA maturation factor